MLPVAPQKEISAPVIEVENLWCGYLERKVLKGVTFKVRQGEFVGVLGPNGSGKTTLLLALAGVIPFQEGKITIFGSPMSRLKHKERARRMAFVVQDSDVRFPFACKEVVRMGRYPHQKRWQMENELDTRAVDKAMHLTDTRSLAERLLTAVSGGEKQRVMVAKALAQATPVLLLDEATSSMDVHRKLQIFQMLEQLNGDENLTVIAVLHDLNLAALFCRRLLFLKEGKILADGKTDEVMTTGLLEKVYQARVLVQDITGTGKKQVFFLPYGNERT